jgi:hypothetical protein
MTHTKTPEHIWEPSTPYRNKEATLMDALQQALAALRLLAPTCLADAGRQDDAIEAAEVALATPEIKVNSAGTVAVAQGVFWLPIDKQAPLGVRLLLINKAAGRATDGQLGSHEGFFDHYQAFPQFRR